MNRSLMRPTNSRPSLMRARPGATTKSKLPSARPAKSGLAKIAKNTRSGMPMFGMKKSRRSSRPAMIAAACVVTVAGIAALPVARRMMRRVAATWQSKRQHKIIIPSGLDELTGLPNRAEAERMLGAALERGQLRGRRVALLYVDLDDFKLCNDTYGSDAGDHVLQVAAARMQAQLRSGDTVCRLAGDDFVVIMESAGPDHTVSRIAERISDAIAQPITFEGETILVGCSVGIAVAVNGEAEINEMIAHGDAAVDRARAAGRHVVQY